MTDDDFNAVFGHRQEPRPSFVERVARPGVPPPTMAPRPRRDLAAETEAATRAIAEDGQYKAFGFIPAGQLNPSCEVRSWMDGTTVPDGTVFFYRLLLQIGFPGDDELRLMLPDAIFVVRGRNLDPLRAALTRHQATFVQQYSPRVWHQAPPGGLTLIEHIEIVRPRS